MNARVPICTPYGQELLSVTVDDFDPYVTLAIRGINIQLTRDEARQVADALRAAALRAPFEDPGGHGE
jgi:preprotein translocase subunit SecD